MKQSQRDALTKERQSYLATGGGPPKEEAIIDPDILNIAPNLMENAPVLFSSNMTEKEIEGMSTKFIQIYTISYIISISNTINIWNLFKYRYIFFLFSYLLSINFR